jgi:hypothetical protein
MKTKIFANIIILSLILTGCASQSQTVLTTIPTSSEEPASTQNPQLIILNPCSVYSGPGSSGFEKIGELTTGDQVTPLGTYNDFILIEKSDLVKGFVPKSDVQTTSQSIPSISSDEVPLQKLDLLPIAFDGGGRTFYKDGVLRLDNSSSSDWYGDSLFDYQLDSSFQFEVQISLTGDFAAIILSGGLSTGNEDIMPKMIIVPDGKIQFQNGIDYNTIEIQVDLPKDQPFIVKFNDPQGKLVTFTDESGNVLKTIDITKDLQGIPAPNGLFPNQELYLGLQAAPKSDLTISKLQLEQVPDGINNAASGKQCTLSAGDRETVMSNKDLSKYGLNYWPDGVMGILRTDKAYTFLAGNSIQIGITSGTLDNPISLSAAPEIKIKNLKQHFDYASGGPVYRDPSGMLLMIYHAENWATNGSDNYYSSLGMAKSTDNGQTWLDLGIIIRQEFDTYDAYAIDIGGGPFVINGDYMYVYYRDALKIGDSRFEVHLAVARARLADVVRAAQKNNTVVDWEKYYQGDWKEPGIAGKASPLETGNLNTDVFDISYDPYLGKYISVLTTTFNGQMNLYYIDSSDGIHWSARQPVDVGAGDGDEVYPTIIGLDDNPQNPGESFYVYYVHTMNWYSDTRWTDASLVRKMITCSGN